MARHGFFYVRKQTGGSNLKKFISQPMIGKSDELISAEENRLLNGASQCAVMTLKSLSAFSTVLLLYS